MLMVEWQRIRQRQRRLRDESPRNDDRLFTAIDMSHDMALAVERHGARCFLALSSTDRHRSSPLVCKWQLSRTMAQ